jgi:drug/metabolite transporter (DMT)-like permease
MVSLVPEFLRIATAAVALVVAAWAAVDAVRDRGPSRAALRGVWVIELFALALVGTALANMAGGESPSSTVTFVGYLIAFLVIPIAGWGLGRLEPTRWGSIVIAVAGVVEAILVVRLEQVWTGI